MLHQILSLIRLLSSHSFGLSLAPSHLPSVGYHLSSFTGSEKQPIFSPFPLCNGIGFFLPRDLNFERGHPFAGTPYIGIFHMSSSSIHASFCAGRS